MQPVRGAKNFNLHYIYSGNRRKVTSVFQLRLVGTSCANVAGCQMKFQAPLTSHKTVSAFSRTTTCILSNIGKTDDNKKKKNVLARIGAFCLENNVISNAEQKHRIYITPSFQRNKKEKKKENHMKKDYRRYFLHCALPLEL